MAAGYGNLAAFKDASKKRLMGNILTGTGSSLAAAYETTGDRLYNGGGNVQFGTDETGAPLYVDRSIPFTPAADGGGSDYTVGSVGVDGEQPEFYDVGGNTPGRSSAAGAQDDATRRKASDLESMKERSLAANAGQIEEAKQRYGGGAGAKDPATLNREKRIAHALTIVAQRMREREALAGNAMPGQAQAVDNATLKGMMKEAWDSLAPYYPEDGSQPTDAPTTGLSAEDISASLAEYGRKIAARTGATAAAPGMPAPPQPPRGLNVAGMIPTGQQSAPPAQRQAPLAQQQAPARSLAPSGWPTSPARSLDPTMPAPPPRSPYAQPMPSGAPPEGKPRVVTTPDGRQQYTVYDNEVAPWNPVNEYTDWAKRTGSVIEPNRNAERPAPSKAKPETTPAISKKTSTSARIGEKKTMNGVTYVRTASGWKPVSKTPTALK